MEADAKNDLTIYRSIMEHLPIAVYDTAAPDGGPDTDGTDVYLNPQLHEFLAIKPGDTRTFNQILFALTHEQDRDDVTAKFMEAMFNHTVYFVECRIKRPTDKDYVWVLLEGKFIYDSNGKAVRHAGIIMNIDDHFQREKQLRESAERYRQITETMSDYVYTVLVKNGVAVETIHGGACQPITGYTPADFAKNPNLWIEMVHEHDRPMVAARAQKMLRGEVVEQIEHRITHRNGKTRWVNSTIVPHRDEHGEITYFDGVIRDITKQKQEAEIIQQRHYMNEILLDSVPFASVLLDEDGEIIAANNQGLMLGFKPNTKWETRWLEMCGDEDLTDILDDIINKSERRQVEIRYQEHHYETTFVPMEPDLCLVCFYDITRRKDFEKAMKRYKLLTDAIVNSGQALVAIINADGTIASINQLLEKFIRRNNAEIKGQMIKEVFDPQQAEAYLHNLAEVLRTRNAVNYSKTYNDYFFDTHALPVFNDEGQVCQVIFFTYDYSAAKRTEQNLLVAYQTLTALVECAPAAIVTFNAEHMVKTWSPAGEELFGWQSVDVIDKPAFWAEDLVTGHLNKERQRLLAGHVIKRVPAQIQCKDGTYRQSFATGSPLLNAAGAIIGYLLIMERA